MLSSIEIYVLVDDGLGFSSRPGNLRPRECFVIQMNCILKPGLLKLPKEMRYETIILIEPENGIRKSSMEIEIRSLTVYIFASYI